MIGLYSYRFSVARGWAWVFERDCLEGISQKWLEVFQKDEPETVFVLSKGKPKHKPEGIK